MRKLLLSVHRYAGLILGLILSITGVSGSLIVFDRELDEWLDPATAEFDPASSVASLDLSLSNAELAVNNGTKPTRIALGRHSGAPHLIRFPTRAGDAGPTEVTVDPGTGQVTSVRVWGEYAVTWIYRLHYSLLAGEVGELVVGILGISLLLFCLTGVVIWWPRQGFKTAKHIKHAFKVRLKGSAAIINYDIHKLLGILSLPLLILIAFTGIEIVWHEPVEQLVGAVLPVIEEPTPSSRITTGRVSVDEVADTALAKFPDARVFRVYIPSSDTAAYQVSLIRSSDSWREFAATKVWVDQYSGAVIDSWDSLNAPAGNKFLSWMFPLHNGDALGFVGRVLVFFAGLLPAIFFVTGFYLWYRRRTV